MGVIQRCKEYIKARIDSFYSSDEDDSIKRPLVCYTFHVVAAIAFALATIWCSLLAKGLLGEMNNGQHHTSEVKTIYIGVIVLLIIIAALCGVAVVGLCVSFIFVLTISTSD